MDSSLLDRIINKLGWLDAPAQATQNALDFFYYHLLGNSGRTIKDLLHGTKLLRHPLHPALTDLPFGVWFVGAVLDYVSYFNNSVSTKAGDICLAVGIIVALPAIASGLTDYHETYGHEQRTAAAHGFLMILVTLLMCVSLGFRWFGSPILHAPAVGLTTLGIGLAGLGMYVGGHLTFAMGTMVNHNAFSYPIEEFVVAGRSDDFPEGKMVRITVAGNPVLMVRLNGRIRAIGAVCSHAGGPLDEGTLEGQNIVCPWHGSRFSLIDGTVKAGPANFAQPVYEVIEQDGNVTLRSKQ